MPEAAATYVSHGCWSSSGRRVALLSRRTAAEDTRYPRTTARRWLPPAPPITLMYTLMYTPLGYVHSVHSFTRSGCPLGLVTVFATSTFFSVWSVWWSTLLGRAHVCSPRGAPHDNLYGRDSTRRLLRESPLTSSIRHSRMPTPAALRLPCPLSCYPTPFPAAGTPSPQHPDSARDDGTQTCQVVPRVGHQTAMRNVRQLHRAANPAELPQPHIDFEV